MEVCTAYSSSNRSDVIPDLDKQSSTEEKHRGLSNYDSGVYVMDAHYKGNVSRFYNHSCSPNVFVQNVFVETWDVRFPWVAFFTTSSIKAGTELVWDYSYEVSSNVRISSSICHC